VGIGSYGVVPKEREQSCWCRTIWTSSAEPNGKQNGSQENGNLLILKGWGGAPLEESGSRLRAGEGTSPSHKVGEMEGVGVKCLSGGGEGVGVVGKRLRWCSD
jgi:hypothetical protein